MKYVHLPYYSGGFPKHSRLCFAGLKCAVDYPSINNGTVSSLESVDMDINGAQANYSCRDMCTLEGSSSLRCRTLPSGSQWINDQMEVNFPSCVCSSGQAVW